MLRRCAPASTSPKWAAAKEKVRLARAMRKAPTISEALLWTALRGRQLNGLKFRRQHVVAGYVVDFYCPALSLAIEVDGPIHRPEEDRVRDEHLAVLGVVVVRFAASNVERNLPGVIASIVETCRERMSK